MYKLDLENLLKPIRLRVSRASRGELDLRSEFESDASRVVFCAASRRMHDKTQVYPLTSGDYVHTRLTHSQEVQKIAESLGVSLCRNKEFHKLYGERAYEYEREICSMLSTAGLIHDIGNPPFGHCAEEVIANYFNGRGRTYIDRLYNENEKLDFLEYDGNASGFRVITKTQYAGDLYGLNLTIPILAAYMKYPNINKKEEKKYIGEKKHGVFVSESKHFQQMVDVLRLQKDDGTIKRYPFTFLVEAADTICYRVMDIDDAFSLRWITLDEVCVMINKYINQHIDITSIDNEWLEDGKFSIQKMLRLNDVADYAENQIYFRVALVRYLVNLALKNFINHLEAIDKGEYSAELLDDDPIHLEQALKHIVKTKVFCRKEIVMAELTGSSVIEGLLNLTLPRIFNNDRRLTDILPKSILRVVHHEAGIYNPQENKEFIPDIKKLPDYYKLRAIVDWISGMTDQYAVSTFRKLNGTNL